MVPEENELRASGNLRSGPPVLSGEPHTLSTGKEQDNPIAEFVADDEDDDDSDSKKMPHLSVE